VKGCGIKWMWKDVDIKEWKDVDIKEWKDVDVGEYEKMWI
jgi:hypothetical protein